MRQFVEMWTEFSQEKGWSIRFGTWIEKLRNQTMIRSNCSNVAPTQTPIHDSLGDFLVRHSDHDLSLTGRCGVSKLLGTSRDKNDDDAAKTRSN